MCGIVGYVGKKQALPILLQGLRDLEYRGYDSAGMAFLEEGKIVRVRAVGKVDELARKLQGSVHKSTIGISHTRWATHGGVTEKNAHPHFSAGGKLALVHNGIIENYREIKKQLEKSGVEFESETDTEVLAHLMAKNYQGDLAKAVKKSLLQVRGTYGILVMHADHPGQLVAARLGSPLAIGIAENEYYIASDVTPMLPYTKQVTFLDDGEVASINPVRSQSSSAAVGAEAHQTSNGGNGEGIKITNLKDQEVKKDITQIEWDTETAQKGGYEHFMLKEIFDQPTVFEDAIRGRLDMEEGTAKLGGLNMTPEQMREIKRVVIVAEGTARHAGLIGKYAFERLASIPTEVDFSSEFRYRDPIVNKST